MEDRTSPSSLPITGGCQCAGLRYEVRDHPVASWACHCSQCRKQSGSAFGLSMIVPLDAFVITQGEPSVWVRTAASGHVVHCLFCGTCGSRIAHRRVENQGKITIKAGTLDDPVWIAPAKHVFTDTALPWTECLWGGE